MPTRTSVTVDVDDRGRFTIPEPARFVTSISSEPATLNLEIRVLQPDDVAGNTATTDARADDRGRVTIKPPEVRSELGIKGREAIAEVTISKKYNHTGADP